VFYVLCSRSISSLPFYVFMVLMSSVGNVTMCCLRGVINDNNILPGHSINSECHRQLTDRRSSRCHLCSAGYYNSTHKAKCYLHCYTIDTSASSSSLTGWARSPVGVDCMCNNPLPLSPVGCLPSQCAQVLLAPVRDIIRPFSTWSPFPCFALHHTKHYGF